MGKAMWWKGFNDAKQKDLCMKQQSEKDRFYNSVGEAMSMNDFRSFINIETLEVDTHASEDYFSWGDEEDSAQEAIENPDKFLPIQNIHSSVGFGVMEDFIETVKSTVLQFQLRQALQGKKPFANFKIKIDNSLERQNWFDFRDQAYAVIAKQWLEDNACEALLEKIKGLPSVFMAE